MIFFHTLDQAIVGTMDKYGRFPLASSSKANTIKNLSPSSAQDWSSAAP